MTCVVVVGSINVDLITRVPRLPRPGETVIEGTFRQAGGGKGANQAMAVAKLGARALLVGCVGDDAFGSQRLAELAEGGVDTSRIELARGEATGMAQILVDLGGENMIAVAPGANSSLRPELVLQAIEGFHAPRAVVLASQEVPAECVMAAAEAAGRRGWRFVLNPAPFRRIEPNLIARCAVITPNRTEIGPLGSAEDLLAAGAGAVVVTLGEEGAEVHRPGADPAHQPAFPTKVVDTTGAGDVFSAALAVALCEGQGLDDAVEMAAAAAAVSTTGVGAAGVLPTYEQVSALCGRSA